MHLRSTLDYRAYVDFAMTGHALWGSVPQVPSLDIYEICRGREPRPQRRACTGTGGPAVPARCMTSPLPPRLREFLATPHLAPL